MCYPRLITVDVIGDALGCSQKQRLVPCALVDNFSGQRITGGKVLMVAFVCRGMDYVGILVTELTRMAVGFSSVFYVPQRIYCGFIANKGLALCKTRNKEINNFNIVNNS